MTDEDFNRILLTAPDGHIQDLISLEASRLRRLRDFVALEFEDQIKSLNKRILALEAENSRLREQLAEASK